MNHLTRIEEEPSLHFSIDAKGMWHAFINGQVIIWLKGKTIDDVVVIREQEGGLYKSKGYPEQALIHDTVEPNELWHRRLAHVHYLLQAKLLKVFHNFKLFEVKNKIRI